MPEQPKYFIKRGEKVIGGGEKKESLKAQKEKPSVPSFKQTLQPKEISEPKLPQEGTENLSGLSDQEKPKEVAKKEMLEKPEEKPEEKEEAKTLLLWKAPSRVFKKRDQKYFTTLGLMIFVLALILIFLKEFLLIAAILALAFVAYVLGTVPPEKIEHKITTQGITSANHTYLWNELSEFWFTEKYAHIVLNVDTNLRFPGRLLILLDGVEKERVEKVLSKYLPFREVPRVSILEKVAEKAVEKFPLER